MAFTNHLRTFPFLLFFHFFFLFFSFLRRPLCRFFFSFGVASISWRYFFFLCCDKLMNGAAVGEEKEIFHSEKNVTRRWMGKSDKMNDKKRIFVIKLMKIAQSKQKYYHWASLERRSVILFFSLFSSIFFYFIFFLSKLTFHFASLTHQNERVREQRSTVGEGCRRCCVFVTPAIHAIHRFIHIFDMMRYAALVHFNRCLTLWEFVHMAL